MMNPGGFGGMSNVGMMQMQQMQMMGAGMGMGGNVGLFYFNGNSLSLQSRLDSMTDADAEMIVDANITVTGTQIQTMNTFSFICTLLLGSILIFPLCFMCCDWWRRCTLDAHDVAPAVYASMARIFRSPNVRNVSLTVVDNTFNSNKAHILYNLISQSQVKGFTFINRAAAYDFLERENSDFSLSMKPIKMINHVVSDIRWANEIVM
jgi:hypothetical protein